jgi:hypothetical protein
MRWLMLFASAVLALAPIGLARDGGAVKSLERRPAGTETEAGSLRITPTHPFSRPPNSQMH